MSNLKNISIKINDLVSERFIRDYDRYHKVYKSSTLTRDERVQLNREFFWCELVDDLRVMFYLMQEMITVDNMWSVPMVTSVEEQSPRRWIFNVKSVVERFGPHDTILFMAYIDAVSWHD